MQAVDLLPDYFFTMPASSTGKYHPNYALGDGGLLRHSQACVRIAYELFRIESWKFTSEEQDLILFSLMFHDGWKQGNPESSTGFTTVLHPMYASQELRKYFTDKMPEKQLNFICACIETHMGQWVNDRSKNAVLKKPKTKYQKFVHLIDYISSRKLIEINFSSSLSTR